MTTLVKRNEDGSVEYFTEPMNIRDHFAAAALCKTLNTKPDYRGAAEEAYLVADQMMIARTKDTNGNMRNKGRQERE